MGYHLNLKTWFLNILKSAALKVFLDTQYLGHGLFYSILFYSILFYSILFHSIPFYSILFYSIRAIPLGTCEKAKACKYKES